MFKTLRFSCFYIVLFFSAKNFAQLDYAKNIINELSSEKMHGRGYVKKGDQKAAKSIQKEFKKIGLSSYSTSHLQHFNFSVNTQPSRLNLKLNNETLIPGVDYLVSPGSPSLKGIFKTQLLTVDDLLNKNKLLEIIKLSEQKILLIDLKNLKTYSKNDQIEVGKIIDYLKFSDEYPAIGALFFTNEKLTWSGSTQQNSKVTFTVSKDIDVKMLKSVSIDLKSKFYKNYTSSNCVGYIKGSSKPDSIIVLSAHYDHLGKMGSKTIFPGANDNASGVALLLSLAKHFSKPENKPKNTLVFIAFGGEELGLLGSKYFIENPLFPLKNISFLWNFDLAGTGEKGIKVVNGWVYKNEFNLLQKINLENNLLSAVEPRGKACNSDHCFFDQLGIKSFYSYTLGGIDAYHDVHDKAETLPLTAFENYQKLITIFLNDFQKRN